MDIYMDSFELPNYPVKGMAMQKTGEKNLFLNVLIENNLSLARV